MIASQLPGSNIGPRGEKLRFVLAQVINECEEQARRGQTDKTDDVLELLAAAQAHLNDILTDAGQTPTE